jgi:hypothetical protein
MKLKDEKIVFLRSTGEIWDDFETQDGVHALPKYDSFITIPDGKIGSLVDYRVIPTLRNEVNYTDASRWATHYAVIADFLKSKKSHMFVCEDTLELPENTVNQIEQLTPSGIKLLANSEKPTQAYILDRTTAKIIQENAYIYYVDFDTMLQHMYALKLIDLEHIPLLKKRPNQTQINNLILAVLVLFFLICIFVMLCPLNGFCWSKDVISLSEMLTPEISSMRTEGAGMSSFQDTVTTCDQ